MRTEKGFASSDARLTCMYGTQRSRDVCELCHGDHECRRSVVNRPRFGGGLARCVGEVENDVSELSMAGAFLV
jgi:hypothetical protein